MATSFNYFHVFNIIYFMYGFIVFIYPGVLYILLLLKDTSYIVSYRYILYSIFVPSLRGDFH